MKNRIVFIHAPGEQRMISIIAAGLWGIADFLNQNGFSPEIIHVGLEEDFYQDSFLPDRYIDDRVLFCGFSVQWFPQLSQALNIAQTIKQKFPKIHIVFGGYTASYFYKDILNGYPFVDGISRGDGEIPLLELAKALQQDKPTFSSIPNYSWRDNGKTVENDFSYIAKVENISNISFASYHKYLCNYSFVEYDYKLNTVLPNAFIKMQPYTIKTFYMTVGRGCQVNCTYCGGGYEAQKIINNRSECLLFPDEVIIETIKEAISNGYKNFYFCFDPFPKSHTFLSLLKQIQKEELDIALSIGVWALISDEAIQELKKTSDNIIIELSPETSDENLRRSNRGFYFSNNELTNTIEKLVKEKIHVQVFFGYFLPGDTEQTVQKTRSLCWELNIKYPTLVEAQYLRYSTDPGSPIYIRPEDFNVDLKVNSLKEHLEFGQNSRRNIMVHNVHSINSRRQEEIDKILTKDATLRICFKELFSIIYKCFESIDSFMEFIDKFYESVEFKSYEFENFDHENLLGLKLVEYFYLYAVKEFTENSLVANVIRFVEFGLRAYAYNYLNTQNANKLYLCSNSMWIMIEEGVFVSKFSYDILDAYKMIPAIEIKKRENYLVFKITNDKQEVAEISEDEYIILNACNTRWNSEDLIYKFVSHETKDFKDNEKKDLFFKTIENLKRKKYIKMWELQYTNGNLN